MSTEEGVAETASGICKSQWSWAMAVHTFCAGRSSTPWRQKKQSPVAQDCFLDKHTQQKHLGIPDPHNSSTAPQSMHKRWVFNLLLSHIVGYQRCTLFHLPKWKKTRRPNRLISTLLQKPIVPREDKEEERALFLQENKSVPSRFPSNSTVRPPASQVTVVLLTTFWMQAAWFCSTPECWLESKFQQLSPETSGQSQATQKWWL